ncbi:glycoside hydrolase family 9 protein [Acetivibrio clariflavus]|uniref:Dockerin-like protein n=1 Tax=Acetivibrio clariflavus (strain DSM 19732 / NBRC 101661 / EBR45) TaxID=720554 RepID=G8LU27_ACECE|nr:glycoside hydrolase family 9 protein [Acetivibrio clariflavus]AEV68415.1 dockerin-like protein [Acetivibrio clariflavus DSM 19732]
MGKSKRFSTKVKSLVASAAIAASAIIPVSISPAYAADVEINYAKALQYSQFFYDANMCGPGVEENNLYDWRGNCHVYDAKLPLDSVNTNMSDSFIEKYRHVLDPDGDGTVDVSGGFHDAGDHVKFGMPEAYAGSTLGWGFYEFREAYEATGQDSHIKTILRYFNDYFMRCTFLDESGKLVAFCYQVGDGDVDHAYWNAPEIDEMFRRGWFANEELPSTDCVSAAAASLAVNYMNFKDEDPEYAAKSLKYAKALFEFAEKTPEKSCNADGPKGYYTSLKWQDDYCWAAAWLFLATEDYHYLEEVWKYYDYYAPSCWTHCWNDVWAGTACIIAEIDDKYDKNSDEFENAYRTATNKSPYEEIDFWSQIAKTVDNWMNGVTVTITPGGYAFLNQWGSARYNTATQLLALVYDKHHGDKPSKYSEWAKSQMDYIMGKNPLNRCYIVGYSENSVKYPHHRAASGLSRCEDPNPHKYVLYGALVGGPDSQDQHIDVTSDYIYNEVAIDYNAAFVGACAGLYKYFGDETMKVTPNFPPKQVVDNPDDDTGAGKYWVEAFCVDIVQSDGPKATEVTLYVYSNARKPSKNISVRYYFDATGMTSLDPNKIELRQLYDQTAAETNYAAVLSGPHHYKDNIYYVEVKWPDFPVANSNKKYQFAIGTYAWQNYWDPSDDWSHQDLPVFNDSWKGVPAKTDYICVYDDGVLVGGIEPDGTTPTVNPPPTPTPTPVTKVIFGDLNGDETVNSIDYAYMKSYLLGMMKEFPSENGLIAADVNGDGDINSVDYALMKMYLLGMIKEFPAASK